MDLNLVYRQILKGLLKAGEENQGYVKKLVHDPNTLYRVRTGRTDNPFQEVANALGHTMDTSLWDMRQMKPTLGALRSSMSRVPTGAESVRLKPLLESQIESGELPGISALALQGVLHPASKTYYFDPFNIRQHPNDLINSLGALLGRKDELRGTTATQDLGSLRSALIKKLLDSTGGLKPVK